MPDSGSLGPKGSESASASFASVDIRAELTSRPCLPPDYETEDRALARLATELDENPELMLQRLTETALELCGADSAGIMLLEVHGGEEVLRSGAGAGMFAEPPDKLLPPDAGPSGVCIDQNATQFMYLPHRHFTELRNEPPFVEKLLVPLLHNRRPVGTLWIATHQLDRKLNGEDERRLRKFANVVSAGWHLWRSNAALKEQLEEHKEELHRAENRLADLHATLAQAHQIERRQLALALYVRFTRELIVLSTQAAMLSKSAPESLEAIQRRIGDLGVKLGSLADEIHRLSHQLHPTLDDFASEAPLWEESASVSPQTPAAQLTLRQREVLRMLSEGHSVKEVASALHISPRTVEFHKYRMMEELGVRTVAELARYAVKIGLVS